MKKIKFLVMVAIVFAAGLFFLTSENLVKADVTKESVIENGVYIGDIDVSGMTVEEATQAVDSYVAGLQEQWITLVGPKDVLRYQLKDLGLSAQTSSAVYEAAAVGNAGSLIKRYKALQDLEKENYVVDMGLSIDKQLTGNKIYDKKSKIDVESINNGLRREGNKFVYVPGQAGNEVDIVTAVNELNEYISTEWLDNHVEEAEFKLASIESQPRGTEEELAVIKDLIGSFSTYYKNVNAGRNNNVENGTAKINGRVLYPGEQLSAYECASPFTRENGYALAGAYSNGEVIESLGGGICQVSSTLYQAALAAELQITQRFAHSMTVGYVDFGGDAAIAGTYKDLKFVNNYNFPIYIEGTTNGETLTFNIYGVETRDKNRKVKYVTEELAKNDPGTEYTFSDEYAVGEMVSTKYKYTGYVVNYWKIVTVNGVQTEKTLVNKSTYRPSVGKVTIGTNGATAEQMAKIQEALATNDDEVIKEVITGLAAGTTTPEEGTTTETGTGTTTPEAGTTTPDAGTTTPDAGNKPQDKPADQKPEHVCDNKVKADKDSHWKEFSSCGKTTNKSAHSYTDKYDATCNDCGYTREVEQKPEDSGENNNSETPGNNPGSDEENQEPGSGSN